MEYQSTPSTAHETNKRPTPWGLFVGLLLILGIIVSGAYYVFIERIQSMHPTPEGSSSDNHSSQ